MTTDIQTKKKRKRNAKYDQATIIKMTLEIEKLKSSKKLPRSLDSMVKHMEKELNSPLAPTTVKNVCENLGISFHSSQDLTRTRLYNDVKQVHWRREMVKAQRQVIANIESELDLEPGCLLACGVDEMLKNAMAGAGTMRKFELPAEAQQQDLEQLKTFLDPEQEFQAF